MSLQQPAASQPEPSSSSTTEPLSDLPPSRTESPHSPPLASPLEHTLSSLSTAVIQTSSPRLPPQLPLLQTPSSLHRSTSPCRSSAPRQSRESTEPHVSTRYTSLQSAPPSRETCSSQQTTTVLSLAPTPSRLRPYRRPVARPTSS